MYPFPKVSNNFWKLVEFFKNFLLSVFGDK